MNLEACLDLHATQLESRNVYSVFEQEKEKQDIYKGVILIV